MNCYKMVTFVFDANYSYRKPFVVKARHQSELFGYT